MAALYLHHALFSDDNLPPPTVAWTSHDRHASSLSSATLRTTFDYSHPTEPLLQPDSANAATAAYADLLSQQPGHPSEPRASWMSGLTLQPGPLTASEQKRVREQTSRRRLRRSRRWIGITFGVIALWTTYSAIRYFVALSLYPTRGRQQAAVALGTISILALVLAAVSASFHMSSTRDLSRRGHSRLGAILNWTLSTFLLVPAVTNLVLVQLWRHLPDKSIATEGRCTWDVDVVWSKPATFCISQHTIAWGYFLTGAIIRLILTLFVLVTNQILWSRYIALNVRSSRRKGGRTHTHSISHRSGSGRQPPTSVRSTRSSRTMVSSLTQPTSLAYSGRQPSLSASEKDSISEGSAGANLPERRSLHRASSGRPSMEPIPSEDRRISRISRYSQTSSEGTIRTSQLRIEEEVSSVTLQNSTNFDLVNTPHRPSQRQAQLLLGAPFTGPSPEDLAGSEQSVWRAGHGPPEDDLRNFVDRFRQLMEEVTLETEAGIELAENDQPGYYTDGPLPSPSASSESTSDEVDYVPIVGSMIQRMPTIESLGSREVMSLAASSVLQRGDRSLHTLSQPPTRTNTLSMSDGGSQPPSRSNSLTASVALSSPSDAYSPNVLGSLG